MQTAVLQEGLRGVREFVRRAAKAAQYLGAEAQGEVAQGADVKQAYQRRPEIDAGDLHVVEGLAHQRHLPAFRRFVYHDVLALGEQVGESPGFVLPADEIPAGHVFAVDEGFFHVATDIKITLLILFSQ